MAVDGKPARKKRRIRSPHPGVVLLKPEAKGRHESWRARFKDPDTGVMTKVRLDPLGVPNADARRDWAIRKAKSIAKRAMELASGAPRSTGTKLSDALDRYFAAHPQLRPRTRDIYRTAADKLVAWGKKSGVESADDLTRAQLLSFREGLIREPKRSAVKKAKRGTYAATSKTRSAAAINQELRSTRTVLGYLRDLDLFPKLSHDDLRRALKRLPATSERLEHLKANECSKLLEAALRHDAATFSATRDEHAGRKAAGTTARFDPIAPFVATVLLTGMRFSEALDLKWSQVDLDALDNNGRKVGEIHLSSADTKTKKPRTIGLEVSPALHTLLSAIKLRSGGKGVVFGFARGTAESAAERLREDYGAPTFTWQTLRRTAGTFLTNAGGIYGSASVFMSAKQLGHSVAVAEKHYLGVLRGIPQDARTLDAAMLLEDVMRQVVQRAGGSEARNVRVLPVKRKRASARA